MVLKLAELLVLRILTVPLKQEVLQGLRTLMALLKLAVQLKPVLLKIPMLSQ